MLLGLSSRASLFCAGSGHVALQHASTPSAELRQRRVCGAGPPMSSGGSLFRALATPSPPSSSSSPTPAGVARRSPFSTSLRPAGVAWGVARSHGDRRFPLHALLAAAEDIQAPRAEAALIDGKAIAETIRREVAAEVAELRASHALSPGLAVLLVGERRDSQSYVRMKKAACAETGIESIGVDLPADASEEEVLTAVRRLNGNPDVHGVLVQLPLPKHVNTERVLAAVSIEKDVDGFHPINMGQLAMAGRRPLFVPCTPKGCIELLLRSGVSMEGKRAVVIGRSNIVGTPAALLLQRHNATVTVVHSRTRDPAAITREADIVIAAAGVAELVRGNWLKPGCVVIDVGINPVDDPSTKRGYRLVGDVCFEEAKQVASMITPVPGGVGPMTIAMLLSNTLLAAKRSKGLVE